MDGMERTRLTLLASLVAVLLTPACKKTGKVSADEPEAPPKKVATTKDKAPEPPKKTSDELMNEQETATAAFAFAKPLMSDVTIDAKKNEGGVLFARWASAHLAWTDVYVANDETSFGKIRKDSEEEIGKRMCISGSIIQIEVVKLDVGKKVSVGLLMSNGGNIYHFVNALSSGEIVQNKYARTCGFVVGAYSYANSGGGTSHGVDLVGIFDLPENKPAKDAGQP